MSVAEFVAGLTDRGVRLWREEGRLRLRAPKGLLDEAARREIAERKGEILDFLETFQFSRPGGASREIGRVARDGALPLSFAQQRLWFLYELDPAGSQYNMPIALRIDGAVDVPALRAALDALARRHEILRTTYETIDGQVRQRIGAAAPVAWQEIDLSGLDETASLAAVTAHGHQPFDLRREHPFRVALFRLAGGGAILLLTTHHIASDGWSTAILLRELGEFYGVARAGRPVPAEEATVQYADFAAWQRDRLSGESLQRLLRFWRQTMADVPRLELPRDRTTADGMSLRGAAAACAVEPALRKGLNRLAAEESATLFMVLLACWSTLLFRYSRQEEFAVGTVIANRNRSALEDIVGLFVNLLPIPVRLDGEMTFRDLLRRLRASSFDAFAHQDLPFERLVEELQPDRVVDATPLVQTVLAVHNTEMAPPALAGLDAHFQVLEVETTRFDLALNAWDLPEQLGLQLIYRDELFERETAASLLDRLLILARAAVANPDQPLFALPLMEADERRRLLVEWNRSEAAFPADRPIQSYLERWAAEDPERLAIEFEGERWTYGELHRRVTLLAAHLRARGVAADRPVGICLERSPLMVVATLAILAAGGTYLPLDPRYPRARIQAIVEDSGTVIALVEAGALALLPENGLDTFRLDTFDWSAPAPAMNPPPFDPDQGFVLYYTSGSTGRPKGALLSHRSVLNYVHWIADRLDEFGVRQIPLIGTLNSDITLKQLFAPLIRGRALWLVPQDTVLQPALLLRELAAHPDAGFNCVPTLWRAILDAIESGFAGTWRPDGLRVLMMGGEETTADLLQRTARHFPQAVVVNLYGPTETTANSAWTRLVPGQPITIGRPVANTTLYVLGPDGAPVPWGMLGELHIGGVGLARGYWRRQDLTDERFIPDPWSPGGRLYRTGDLARWRRDGRVEFRGRIDQQVKIRGFRVETRDVATALEAHPLVREAVVMVREADGDKRLVAYVLHAEGRREGDAAMSGILEERLSEWQQVHDANYARDIERAAEEGDFIGWVSSYTGGMIAVEDMTVWADSTFERLRGLAPRRVLEIGCGSGLLLTRLAPDMAAYRGTDYSPTCVARLRAKLADPRFGHVVLETRTADDLRGIEPGAYDTVVLNSIVQYFPSVDYLLAVIDGAANMLAPGGTIWVGDVRSAELHDAFHFSVELFKAPEAEPGDRVLRRARAAATSEKELVVSPAFFAALRRHLPRLSSVELLHKRGKNRNELTRFRYDAILRFDAPVTPLPADLVERDYVADRIAGVGGIAALLDAATGAPVRVRGIANGRIEADLAALEMLREGRRSSAGELRRIAAAASGIDPEDLWALAEARDLTIHLLLSDGDRGAIDLVAVPAGTDAAVTRALLAPAMAAQEQPWHAFANQPLLDKINERLAPELRRHVAERLPDFMVPHAIVVLDTFPQTPNGKVDLKALPEPGGHRIESGAGIVPPSTEREAMLWQIWKELLKTDRFGIHDNFFQLGGDSIVSLQVIARAQRVGLALTPRAIFEAQTIAKLAALAGDHVVQRAEQGELVGPVALTPIQRRFLALEAPQPHHYNQAVLLEIDRDLAPAALDYAIATVAVHHDALRLRFDLDADGAWRQRYVGAAEAPMTLEAAEFSDAHLAQVQASLDLASGPIARFVRYDLGPDHRARLLIVIHHLAIDGVSWRILLEDLHEAVRAHRAGTAVALPPKTASFRAWAGSLETFASSPALAAQASYWQDVVRARSVRLPRLPSDTALNIEGRRHEFASELDAGTTQSLIGRTGEAYRTEIDDLLLAALAMAVAEVAGEGPVRIARESHGRRSETLDLSRSVGWFTALFPVMLDLAGTNDPARAIKSVKEQLRRVPDGGLGYGILRYLTQAGLEAGSEPEIAFNYLGRFHEGDEAGSEIRLLADSTGPQRGASAPRVHLLDVNAAVLEGRLQLTWNFAGDMLARDIVEALVRHYERALRTLIEHCLDPRAGGQTPSDFPDLEISQAELDDIVPAVLASAGLPATRHAVESMLPLSPIQQGMLFHVLYAPEESPYVDHIGFTMVGRFAKAPFQAAWRWVVAGHAALRTGIFTDLRTDPFAVVFRDAVLADSSVQDLQTLDADTQRAAIDAFVLADRKRGFDLSCPPLLRLALFRLAADRVRVVLTSHHLMLDGWSLFLLLARAKEAYTALVAGGRPAPLPPTPGYEQYLRWLNAWPSDKAELFWQQRLDGIDGATPLPRGLSLEAMPPGPAEPDAARHLLGEALGAGLARVGQSHGLTLNTLLRGAWALLLGQHAGAGEVVFGSAVSGRPTGLAGFDTMVGLFINTVPVRVTLDGSATVRSWLGDLQAAQVEENEHSYLSLARIREHAKVPPGQALFDSILVLENYPIAGDAARWGAGLSVADVHGWSGTNYPLVLLVVPGMRPSLTLKYDRRRYSRDAVAALLVQFETLLAGLLENLDRPLRNVSLLAEAEHRALLAQDNDTARDYPQGLCLHRLFESQVPVTPDAVAVACEDHRLSYAELERAANQLAHHLRSLGVGSEDRVGLFLGRSVEFIIGLLAALKAGGCYVPLDPESPPDRLAYLIANAGIKALVTREELAERLPAGVAHVVCVDRDAPAIEGCPAEVPAVAVAPEQIAYVIYTSGSTGQPKGVAVEHRQIVNYVHGIIERLDLRPGASFAMVQPTTFDSCHTVLFPAFHTGGTLHLMTERRATDGAALAEYFDAHRIDLLKITPSHFAALAGSDLAGRLMPRRWMVLGGESANWPLIEALHAARPQCRMFFHYGPTEATVGTLVYDVPASQPQNGPALLPLGPAMANTRIYLLDPEMRPVPVGVTGELYLGGACVARGYIGSPELTAKVFVADPFAREPGARMYRTGDYARRYPDGTFEFLGRRDFQVKISGFRIEMGEVEAALRDQAEVAEAFVDAPVDATGHRRLVAYVVPRGLAPTGAQLRAALRDQLPAHMVPAAVVFIDALPLTRNGKVDRAALLRLSWSEDPGADHVAPRTALEVLLVEIWQDVLARRPIGITDNFFDLGGQSLKAIMLMARLQQRIGRRHPLAMLFRAPTVEQFARALGAEPGPWQPLVPIRAGGRRTPLFLVPGGWGAALSFAALGRHLESDRPIHAMEARGIDGALAPQAGIEDMAASYVAAIRAVQPEGPYLLAGYSFGGVVAFEMAHRLCAIGQKVALLALLDSRAPGLAGRQAEQVDEAELRAKGLVPPDVDSDTLQAHLRVLEANRVAAARYVPRPLAQRAILYRAQQEAAGEPSYGWTRWLGDSVGVREVPGNHFTMMTDPLVQALAAHLDEALGG